MLGNNSMFLLFFCDFLLYTIFSSCLFRSFYVFYSLIFENNKYVFVTSSYGVKAAYYRRIYMISFRLNHIVIYEVKRMCNEDLFLAINILLVPNKILNLLILFLSFFLKEVEVLIVHL